MAEQAVLAQPAEGAVLAQPADQAIALPAERGWLRIDDRVAQRIAEQAALGVPGVVRHQATLRRVTGRALPRTEVVVAGTRARASLDIAITWPQPLAATAAAVRHAVATQLRQLAGLTADAVEVCVTHVVLPGPGTQGSPTRRVL